MGPICKDCGVELNIVEIIYYEVRCESCERAWDYRLTQYRHGKPDPELDAMFSGNTL